jgi:hypothetical protein
MAEPTSTQEGPRSFTRFLEQLGGGQAHSELSQAMFELGATLRHEALNGRGECKGELHLAVKFKVDQFGQVMVGYSIKTKEPEPGRPGTMMWLTRGGNFSIENPRQTSLPLREVVNEDGEVVEDFEERRPAREV